MNIYKNENEDIDKNLYRTIYHFENDNSMNMHHLVTIMVVIIFCLIFVIFLTIFDYYKKPSIYELELLNEFKSNCSSNNNCEEEANTEEKQNKRMMMIYKDILYLLFYIIALYLLSLTFLPEPVIAFFAIFLIVCIVKIKRH